MAKMFRVNKKEVYLSIPTGEKVGELFQGARPCILLSGSGLGFREERDLEKIFFRNLERMVLGQFGRDFDVPA